MAPHSPRKSSSGLFPQLQISPSPHSMRAKLQSSIRLNGWPSWRTLRWSAESVPPHRCDFTLHMNNEYLTYWTDQEDPDVVFRRISSIMAELEPVLARAEEGSDSMQTYIEFIYDCMAEAIFGSNMIERAGGPYDVTYKLCTRVFNGEQIDASLESRTPEYEEAVQGLRGMGITDPNMEKTNHFSEKLILDTHRILCTGIAVDPNHPGASENYAGKYRKHDVRAGETTFTSWHNVPAEMAIFIQDFADDIQQREKTGDMDPFYLAADACQDFVTIHPFADGNGRMCRLILNAFLIKYSGVVVNLGASAQDREDYLTLAAEAGDGDTEEQAKSKLANMVLIKASHTLSRLKAKLLWTPCESTR